MSNDNWEVQLTIPEKNTFLEHFRKVDADNKGIVLKDEAMAFLKTSSIPENILLEFWNVADDDKKGFLTDREFCIILKLIACAQHGVMISEPVLTTRAPLPEFNDRLSNNIQPPTSTSPPQTQNSPQHSRQQFQNNNLDIISPENRQKYIKLFESFGPINNILSSEKAKFAFTRSNLPPAVLQVIWDLADTRKSGTLNQTEFIIAMHYIEKAMKGGVNVLPAILPGETYASATGRAIAPSPLARHNTLQVSSPKNIPARSPILSKAPGIVLEIPSEDFSKYKTYFHQIENENSGFVTGADAVVFFKHSGLPPTDLARIWDLADTNSTGQLNEKEFAIAMHLINRKNAGGDIPAAVSSVNIVSSANQSVQQQQQQQQDTADLLGLFTDFAAPATQPVAPVPQQPVNQNNLFAGNQSAIQTETNQLQTVQTQLSTESQAIQEIQKQIEQQKQHLANIKQEAAEAERQLLAEKQRKESLVKELQMYKQEIKHFSARLENTKQETESLKKENTDLEKEINASKEPISQNVFSLSNANSPGGSQLFAKVEDVRSPNALFGKVEDTASPNALFAKVEDARSPNTLFAKEEDTGTPNNLFAKVEDTQSPKALFAKVEDTQSPKALFAKVDDSATTKSQTFDPFAGFKATQAPQRSATVTLNKLKEAKELKRSYSASPNVDISEIESKFPDLSTMEEQFNKPQSIPESTSPVSRSPVVSKKETDIYSSLFSPVETKQPEPQSKYKFDLSAFESPSSTFQSPSNVKDELSSLFGSPSTQPATSDFDNIFGNK